jgi:hypothetical protein
LFFGILFGWNEKKSKGKEWNPSEGKNKKTKRKRLKGTLAPIFLILTI